MRTAESPAPANPRQGTSQRAARPLLLLARMTRSAAFALAPLAFALLLATGCVTTETVPVLYRIPLEGNSRGSEAARACAAACRSANGSSDSGFFACIGTCPDAQVVRDAECSPDEGEASPVALCYTRLVERDVPDPAVANFLGDLIGAIAEAGIHAAVRGEHDDHHESRHEKAEDANHAERAESHRSTPRPERRAAARPRRGS